MIRIPTFYMIVGVPGSGKSTYCKKHIEDWGGGVHISSDEIRKELYGDESIQGNPEEVFSLMYKRTLEILNQEKDVFYDATNIKRKDRIGILNQLPPYVKKVCYVIWARIETCMQRDSKRKKSVGKDVINRMLKNFECPFYDEGYYHISVVCTEKFNEKEYCEELVENMKTPHDNPHHTYNIYEHCKKSAEILYSKYPSDVLEYYTAMYHDIGKPYCKSFVNTEGETTDVAHYYGHQGVGAWMVLGTRDRSVYMSWLISHHMDPYLNTKYYRGLPEMFKRKIDMIHDVDSEAH